MKKFTLSFLFVSAVTLLSGCGKDLGTSSQVSGDPKYDPETTRLQQNFKLAFQTGQVVKSWEEVEIVGKEWKCERRDATTPLRPNVIGSGPRYEAPTAADSHNQAVRFRFNAGAPQERVFDEVFLQEGYDPIVGNMSLTERGLTGSYNHLILNPKMRWLGFQGNYIRAFFKGSVENTLVFEDVMTSPLTAQQKLYLSAPQALTAPTQLAAGYGYCVLGVETPKFKRTKATGERYIVSPLLTWIWDSNRNVWVKPHNGCIDPECQVDIENTRRDAFRQATLACETQKASLLNAGQCTATITESGLTGFHLGHPYARASWQVPYDVPVE